MNQPRLNIKALLSLPTELIAEKLIDKLAVEAARLQQKPAYKWDAEDRANARHLRQAAALLVKGKA